MNWQLLLPLLITTSVGVGGWIVGHQLNMARDREAKRRELRLQYAIEAYRALVNFAGRNPPFAESQVEGLQKAVADIQLFGSEAQVQQLGRAFQEQKRHGASDLKLVINELRHELRKELNLPPLQENVTWVRIDPEYISEA